MKLTIFAVIFYLLAILSIVPMLVKVQAGNSSVRPNKALFFVSAILAISCHLAAPQGIVSHILNGESFTLMGISALFSVLISALATLAVAFGVKTLWFLLPIVYSFSIINLMLMHILPPQLIQDLELNFGLHLHITLAMFAYAVCFMATLYAMQLAWIDRNLKRKKMAISPIMPPLMTVERHFFNLLFSGELLLTFTLLSGAVYLNDFFAAPNGHKAILSFCAWMVFAIALFGQWKLHWRGKRMIIYAIFGMILLTLAYFGSRAMFIAA